MINHRHQSKVRVIENGKMQKFTEKNINFGPFRYHSINTPVSWVLGLPKYIIFNTQNFLQMTHFRVIL